MNNGAGLIRLTVTAHTLATGDVVPVQNVGGVPNATGLFTVTSVDANHVDLQNSVFVGTYTSGGTINRLLHITGAANNGSGLIRITIAAHGYVTGDEVNIVSVGGVPNATGQWIITVVTANTFDLQASTFAGAYTSGGTCLRYFAGMLAQTFAVGPSFANYKLRAFADGSLKINGAIFTLDANGITTTIGNESVGGVGVVGVEVQNNSTADAIVLTPTFTAFYNTDPANNHVSVSMGRNGTAGIVRVLDGSGAGGIDGHGLKIALDGSNAHVTIDASGAIFIGANRVVGPQLPAVASPSVSTSNTASTAGATYTATEQAMLNSLKLAVQQLNTDVVNLKTRTMRSAACLVPRWAVTA